MSGAEWAVCEPLLPAPAWLAGRGGRPASWCMRDIVDAIRYLTHNGPVWRALPADFPPAWTVYYWAAKWEADGSTRRMHDDLRERVRAAAGRPTLGHHPPQGCNGPPHTAETRGMVGAAQYAMMQPHAYFITTARGGIHDEAALLDALTQVLTQTWTLAGPDGNTREISLGLRQFFPQELRSLLQAQGFEIISAAGGFQGEALASASLKQVFCCRFGG